MRLLIRRLAEKHAILFSTHLLSEATEVCSHVCVIHQGRVLKELSLTEQAASETTVMRLSTRERLSVSRLLRVGGVLAAEPSNEHDWILTVQPSASDKILQRIVNQGWHVLEFGAEKKPLEALFNELIRTDSPSVSTDSKELLPVDHPVAPSPTTLNDPVQTQLKREEEPA